ncbi:YqgE/AlgH family protein [Lutibacter sp. B1]|jgi:putative transcriptional regulator|uniref:YqgE/AlgH family protein n=1 Tax=Lutibacter sp. B1 TaxID=2725996 RepID=UPI0014576F06|nr:YqgE/AlgH family protein [Lutibacter sp. B1]NLP57944.1 YqgE/AlgH family protein [Lutibacter sp. B1]
MLELSPSKGKLLVAEPSILNDIEFNRSVIYLTEHNKDGCIGFILNKPTDYILNDLIPEISCDFKIYNGGPVEQENLYFIHKIPELVPNSIEIDKDIYWGGDFDALTKLLNSNSIKKTDIRFFLGYSGWSVDQLKEELNESTWIVVNNRYPNLFNIDSDDIWKNQLMAFGGEYQIWANAPKNPALN